MTITNPPKAFIALVALICITLLRALDKLDQASFNAIAGLLVGYAVGNGIAARQGQPVQPIIGAKSDD
jgi:hydrogenase/urease accessory protein HupE